jgi:hypothetical protein
MVDRNEIAEAPRQIISSTTVAAFGTGDAFSKGGDFGACSFESSTTASAGMRFRPSATISSRGTMATHHCFPRTPGDETTKDSADRTFDHVPLLA